MGQWELMDPFGGYVVTYEAHVGEKMTDVSITTE